ncbi:bifunctional endoribonuclease/protein kinase ire1 [Physocladia obscura]|uniref:non-specific serine/threonine protein kinase n=1 Tax=Physocladia obscura TaxID=109957 RepID=A0AAD5X9F5_9FUNG|nr:bifunctional endoribonuclease/protein kinase ire1 [Physocladia obscura]
MALLMWTLFWVVWLRLVLVVTRAEPGGPPGVLTRFRSEAEADTDAQQRHLVAVSPAAHSTLHTHSTHTGSNNGAAGPNGGLAADLVVVTVDGGMHGVVRATGETVWSTRHPWGALANVADVSVSSSSAAPSKSGADDKSTAGDSYNSNSSNDNNKANTIAPDALLIPEPLANGNLYLYSYAPSSSPSESESHDNAPLKKLPFNIKDIVAHNSFVTDGNIAYSSKKVSRLIAVDPLTGAILQSIGVDIDNKSPLPTTTTTASGLPPIFISRTEYMLMISDLVTNSVKWNITYGELSPATIPKNLFDVEKSPPSPHPSNNNNNPSDKDVVLANSAKGIAKNRLSVSASVDGTFVIDDLDNENAWELKFDTPVLAAFSVMVQQQDSPQQQQQLEKIEFTPPPPPPSPLKSDVRINYGSSSRSQSLRKAAADAASASKNNNQVFVGLVGESYYVLSAENSRMSGIVNSPQLISNTSTSPSSSQKSEKEIIAVITKPPSLPAPSANTNNEPSTMSNPPKNLAVGIHSLPPPPASSQPPKYYRTPSSLIPFPTPPTPQEWHEFFHVTSHYKLIERILGFTERTEEFFVFAVTVLFVCAAAVIWVWKGGDVGLQYRKVVNRLNECDVSAIVDPIGFCREKSGDGNNNDSCGLLPYHREIETSSSSASNSRDVLLVKADKDQEKQMEVEAEELRKAEEQKAGRLPKVNPFDILDNILNAAKALPAIPIDSSSTASASKKKKKDKLLGVSNEDDEFDISTMTLSKAGSSLPKTNKSSGKRAKKLGFSNTKTLLPPYPSASGSKTTTATKETSIEILSDSTSNDDEENNEEKLDFDNMDRLLSQKRFDSNITATNTTVITLDTKEDVLKTMTVSEQVLGHGSHGTMVFKGTFEGRPVAIKRLLLDFYDVAHHEVKILRDSDQHQNVESTERFMYIALELCPASLADVIENVTPEMSTLRNLLKPRSVLSQITAGIQYLHSLKLVHRDIKPQNILIGESKGKLAMHPRILITDFGLCKRLADDQSSFHNTIHTAGGTIGWRAPECMINHKPEVPATTSESSEPSSQQWVLLAPSTKMRITKSIDVFSAGCVFYYYLTGGVHPFGDKYTREINILRGNYRLERLDSVEGGFEAKELIRKMIFKDPKKRPDTQTILLHPYFWPTSRKLAFLQEVSDRLETEPRDPPSGILKQLERGAEKIVGSKTWAAKLDRRILEDVRSFRQYDTKTIQDLLRVIRNKRNHYQELSEEVKTKVLGGSGGTDGLFEYFAGKFPGLFMHVYHMVSENKGLKGEPGFLAYYE